MTSSGCRLGSSSASFDAVAYSGYNRMTNFSELLQLLVTGLPPGKSIAFGISKVSRKKLGKLFTNYNISRKKEVGLNGFSEEAHKVLEVI